MDSDSSRRRARIGDLAILASEASRAHLQGRRDVEHGIVGAGALKELAIAEQRAARDLRAAIEEHQRLSLTEQLQRGVDELPPRTEPPQK